MLGPKKRGRPKIERPPPVDFDDHLVRPSPVDGLLTATQRRLLRLLFGEPGRAYGVRELRDLTRSGAGATQRAMHRLAGAGLITTKRVGNRVMVQANPDSAIHEELTETVRKTIGLAEPMREAFGALESRITAAYAFEPERDPLDRRSRGLGMLVLSDNLEAWGADLLVARDLAEHLLGRSLWIVVRRETDDLVEEFLRRPGAWVFKSTRARCGGPAPATTVPRPRTTPSKAA